MHILIIDDIPDFRALLRKLLNKAFPDATVSEYDPLTQEHVADKLSWKEYDVLILDYQLGLYTGLELLKEFNELASFPPTIFLTAEGDEMVAVEAMKLGVNEYIRKDDLDLTVLKSAIMNIVSAEIKELPRETTQEITSPLQQTAPTNKPFISQPIIEENQFIAANMKLDGYEVFDHLGKGGMATVFRARKTDSDNDVAIKFLDASEITNKSDIGRFIEEYSLLISLEHPNLINIYEQGFTDKFGYIVMEIMKGGDLRQRLKEKTIIPYEIAINYMHTIVLALKALHEAEIIHRDLKPGNVMFRSDDTLVLTDFGNAIKLDANLDITLDGEIMGTPSYISPEQIKNDSIDKRADLYSLGILFYEMLTGRPPFEAKSLHDLMYKHLNEIPADIPDMPEKVNAIIQKLLAKDPDERYQDAGILLLKLEML